MNLLPKAHEEFGHKDYWNTFFKKRGNKAFEWYGEYPEICSQLHKYIKPKDEILTVGCGNSKLSADMYDVGYRQMVNIDISPIVIKQMESSNKVDRPDLVFLVMDATQMSFPDAKFSAVLDKGTLDALFTDESNDVVATVEKYWGEINRVLRIGGRYVCVSLLQEHILQKVVAYFPSNQWMLRIVRCHEAEQKNISTSTNGTTMPVFMIIATKFQKLPRPILEVCMGGDQMQRVENDTEMISAINTALRAALVCNGLTKTNIAGALDALTTNYGNGKPIVFAKLNYFRRVDMDEVSIDLYQPGNATTPRFTVHVLDQQPVRGHGKYAVFIVPQGREAEWLFSTKGGRRKLIGSTPFTRIAIVSTHRGHTYTTWDNVKDEISESVKSLAPHGITEQIPYISIGSDVSKRDTIFKGHSELSGDYIVEEISNETDKIFRRLIFLSNQGVIQSEALVKVVNAKNKPPKKVIDHRYLACQHHLYMIVGTQLAIAEAPAAGKQKKRALEVAVIGLGGGGLCTFMHQCLRNVSITAVDIDAAMVKVATEFFGLTQDKRLSVVVDDGLMFLEKSAQSGKHFDAILFDVDSKDSSLGMSCPPQAFLEHKTIETVKQCLTASGVFVLNLVCRDDTLRDRVVNDLHQLFPSVCAYKLSEDVNEVIFCRMNADTSSRENWTKTLNAASREINQNAKRYQLATDEEELIDVDEFLKALVI